MLNSIIRKIASAKSARAILLPLLKTIAWDTSIKHHWTGDRFTVNTFRHKGYWFHGENRENSEMMAIKALVNPGDVVAEVGAHIGYLSLWFKKCSGEQGKVVVFEPGLNNLPYLKENIKNTSIELVEAGCGDVDGYAEFYIDDLSGQSNSFVKDYSGIQTNISLAPNVSVKIETTTVRMLRLDGFLKEEQPDFVKIDAEGFDYDVLKGASGLLDNGKIPPVFMVEALEEYQYQVFDWLLTRGYKVFDLERVRIEDPRQFSSSLNFFALHDQYHTQKMKSFLQLGAT
jgi:FkbM family methyltransferase